MECFGLAGDSVLTAILTRQSRVRNTEFSHEPRAGFCMIGACQDCWVWYEDGSRLRACTTRLRADVRLCTAAPLAEGVL
ncbi:2Fe-2S iron-sulfur cluster-binding protein [Bordetella sp. 02P26C-1]|uniref:2Fe-2S iron-sulfur cluster-binding protein n=1 Tax=unclassified Bordetella TaxID=2630031 RepID=UPI0030144C94